MCHNTKMQKSKRNNIQFPEATVENGLWEGALTTCSNQYLVFGPSLRCYLRFRRPGCWKRTLRYCDYLVPAMLLEFPSEGSGWSHYRSCKNIFNPETRQWAGCGIKKLLFSLELGGQGHRGWGQGWDTDSWDVGKVFKNPIGVWQVGELLLSRGSPEVKGDSDFDLESEDCKSNKHR